MSKPPSGTAASTTRNQDASCSSLRMASTGIPTSRSGRSSRGESFIARVSESKSPGVGRVGVEEFGSCASRVQLVRLDLHHKHQYRLAMCGHKAVEVAGVCML